MLCLKKSYLLVCTFLCLFYLYTSKITFDHFFPKMLLFHLRDNFNNTEYIMMLQGPLLDTLCNATKCKYIAANIVTYSFKTNAPNYLENLQ